MEEREKGGRERRRESRVGRKRGGRRGGDWEERRGF